jgi:hypothetical protein
MGIGRFNQKSSRIIVQGDDIEVVKRRVKENEARGFVPLMEIKEEIDFMGAAYHVCVMENPKLKAKRELERQALEAKRRNRSV